MMFYPIVRTLAYSIWAVAGLLLWIPFIARSVIAFNSAMIFATVTRDTAKLTNARNALDVATIFYVLGFQNIHDFTQPDACDLPAPQSGGRKANLAGFTLELTWTVCWWALVIYHKAIVASLTQDTLASGVVIALVAFVTGVAITVALFVNARKRKE